MMKRTLILLFLLSPFLIIAQKKDKPKKYPSLLWEISGNGLKKPSYLFGTMHVSSKIAFHLADSFYLGIRNADVVALETNPESWQEDMSKYEINYNYASAGRYGSLLSMPNDYLTINTLKYYKYDKKIERALYSNPSTINNLLYRSYGNDASDFEEDTYLDMYIYQCGKKWGKRVAGVEQYGESMKLMQEAYKDAAKEKNRKEKSYDVDEDYTPGKLQEAYRKGNLDQLDSINKLNSSSDAFDEKFLYKRNEIQANSIDSILRSKATLFVGVGAAHLPGNRGVIEMLRQKGYRLRPVMIGERDSKHKEEVEKVRVPVVFKTETAEDGFYKVDVPGKFYKFGEESSVYQRQYADMANGSYYMVTRIMTNAWMWDHNENTVYKKIDSLLYENIPGKIISKSKITKNGYAGFDIVNKTRRGDIQRYNIFITPFEIILFKMSGTGEYVKAGTEADRFFNSIQLKEYTASSGWKNFSPVYGGFSVDLPHDAYIGNDGSWIYDAADKKQGIQYRIVRTDIHNYSFAEEDTFDLGLLDESFGASEFIDKQLSRKQSKFKGYPSLDAKYKDKNGNIYLVRYLIQGPHYYTLIAKGKKETPDMQTFLNSFEIKPFVYADTKERRDTSLYYSVKSPVFPEEDKEKLEMPAYGFGYNDGEEDESETDQLDGGAYRSATISNDSTGEKVFVSFFKSARYYYSKDSTSLEKETENSFMGDSTWVIRSRNKFELPDKMKVFEYMVSDTGSSRMVWTKNFYKDGMGFSITTLTDTLTPPSSFLQSFFKTFSPADTLKGVNPFEKKSSLFFADFMSADSVAHKRAVKNIELIKLDSTDIPQLKKAIASLSWTEKKYLDTKKALIGKFDDIVTSEAANYLKDTYYAAGDTIELQYVALETLLKHNNQYAYNLFRDIIASEPPVLENKSDNDYGVNIYKYLSGNDRRFAGLFNYSNGTFIDELYDSLKLTRTILPELLPLVNLEDYRPHILRLLGQMADSNLVSTNDYEMYYSKFFLEAKQELKKQVIAEKKAAIQKAEEDKLDTKPFKSFYEKDMDDNGNDDLSLYATLLMPFWDTKPAVQPLLNQMLSSNDKRLKYNTMLLMIRNKKTFPDTLLKYYAGMDEYSYELYTDLKLLKKKELFPKTFNNHIDLGRSMLMASKSYGKPDTIAYVDKLTTEIKGEKRLAYFFKYKTKKDDANWKLAIVGLLPENPNEFEMEEKDNENELSISSVVVPGWHSSYNANGISGFLEEKINSDEPLKNQLQKELKKKLYSQRKSAKRFYTEGDYDYSDYLSGGKYEFGD